MKNLRYDLHYLLYVSLHGFNGSVPNENSRGAELHTVGLNKKPFLTESMATETKERLKEIAWKMQKSM